MLALSGCGPTPQESRRTAPMIDVAELSVTDAQGKMAGGEFTSHELAQAYLDRIQAIDRQGPTLNAVIELNPDAFRTQTASMPNAPPANCAGRSTAYRCS